LEQGIKVRLTLESDFAGLENGFTGVPNKILVASRRFRTIGGERKPYSSPNGQNRTARIPVGGSVQVKDVTESTEGEQEVMGMGPAKELRYGPPLKSCFYLVISSKKHDFKSG
jgi:hypothetical protein